MTTFLERVEIAANGRTMAEIQRAGGLGADVIRDLKRAKSRAPRVDTALALARGLRVNPSWLAFELGPKDMSDQVEISEIVAGMEPALRAEVLSLLRDWPQVQPGELQKIRDFLRHFSPSNGAPPAPGGAAPRELDPNPV